MMATSPRLSLVLLADTHVPGRARTLPAQVWAAVADADVVLHAGDWVDVALFEELSARAKHVVGVFGNNDGAPLRACLPEVARVALAGLEVAVLHDSGPARGREQRCDCDPRLAGAALVVFGHSHVPWDSTTPRGVRLLNPGSPTDRRREPFPTYLTASVQDGRLDDVVLHRLPLPDPT